MKENFHEHRQDDTPLFREQRFIWADGGGGSESPTPSGEEDAESPKDKDKKDKVALAEKLRKKISDMKESPDLKTIKESFTDILKSSDKSAKELRHLALHIKGILGDAKINVSTDLLDTPEELSTLAIESGLFTPPELFSIGKEAGAASASPRTSSPGRSVAPPESHGRLEASWPAIADAIVGDPELVEDYRKIISAVGKRKRIRSQRTLGLIRRANLRTMNLAEVRRMDPAQIKAILPRSPEEIQDFARLVRRTGIQRARDLIYDRWQSAELPDLKKRLTEIQRRRWKITGNRSMHEREYRQLGHEYTIVSNIFKEQNNGVSFMQFMRDSNEDYATAFNKEYKAHMGRLGVKALAAEWRDAATKAQEHADLVIMANWHKRGMHGSQYRGEREASRAHVERTTGVDLPRRKRTELPGYTVLPMRGGNRARSDYGREMEGYYNARGGRKEVNRAQRELAERQIPDLRETVEKGYDDLKNSGDRLVKKTYKAIMDRLEQNMKRYKDDVPQEIFNQLRTAQERLNVLQARTEEAKRMKENVTNDPELAKREYSVGGSFIGASDVLIIVPKEYRHMGSGSDGRIAINDPRRNKGVFWHAAGEKLAREAGIRITQTQDGTTVEFTKPGDFISQGEKIHVITQEEKDKAEELEEKTKELEAAQVAELKNTLTPAVEDVGFRIERVEYRMPGTLFDSEFAVSISNRNTTGKLNSMAQWGDSLLFDSTEDVDIIEAKVRRRLTQYKKMHDAAAKMADSIRDVIGTKLPYNSLKFIAKPSYTNDENFKFNFYTPDKKGGPKITIEKCDPEKWETQLGKDLKKLEKYMEDIEGDSDIKETEKKEEDDLDKDLDAYNKELDKLSEDEKK